MAGVSGVSGLSVLPFGQSEYYQKVASIAPANLITYWPMWEAAGLVSHDISGNSPAGERDGVYQGVTLGQPGIGDGQTSALLDGINDYNNIQTASLIAAFDGSEGSAMVWVRVANAGVWTDGTARQALSLVVDGANQLLLRRWTTNNRLLFTYIAAGVVKQVDTVAFGGVLDWMQWLVTWSVADDTFRGFIDGVQVGGDFNALGVWAGNLSVSIIGAGSLVPAAVWHGYLAHVALWDTPLTPEQAAVLAVV